MASPTDARVVAMRGADPLAIGANREDLHGEGPTRQAAQVDGRAQPPASGEERNPAPVEIDRGRAQPAGQAQDDVAPAGAARRTQAERPRGHVVARALGGKPSILLADEPTGNLDSRNGEAVMELLQNLHREGATICMVTHDPRFAKHAQREVHLFDGKVVAEEDLKKLMADVHA